MFHRLIILLMVFGLLGQVMLQPALADDAINPVTFTVSPALVDKKVQPGEKVSVTISLYNHSSTPQPFRAYSKDFAAKGLDGEVTFGDESISSYAASSWVSLDQPSLVLPPDGQQQVVATISVPLNAEPGGHYASVLFEQMVQSLPSDTSHVSVAARLASLLFLTVSGKVVEAGQILGATPGSACSAVVCGFKAPEFVDHGPVPFSFIFNNTGNVHVRPKGSITISQNGKTVATLPIEDRAVLPTSERLFNASWSRVVLAGNYTAKLHLVYGSNNYTLDATTTFWAFPWQVVLGVAIVILLGMGLFLSRKYFRVQRLHKKIKSK
jgi:hypothetical protein